MKQQEVTGTDRSRHPPLAWARGYSDKVGKRGYGLGKLGDWWGKLVDGDRNPSTEVSPPPTSNSNDEVPRDQENLVPEISYSNGGTESEHKFFRDEVRGVLAVIASTGKFC
ncbi:hypothetical protein Ancab_019352 [Ancistrocladus abbreviatus]